MQYSNFTPKKAILDIVESTPARPCKEGYMILVSEVINTYNFTYGDLDQESIRTIIKVLAKENDWELIPSKATSDMPIGIKF